MEKPLYSLSSTIVALSALILLYFPNLFLPIAFSPVLLFTGALLLALLRLGATQKREIDYSPPDEDHKLESISSPKSQTGSVFDSDLDLDLDSKPFYVESFVEWNVRAPLEVIYEEYEEEDEDDDDDCCGEKGERREMGIERYPSLSLYYPETDSDSSSEGEYPMGGWDSPESRWDSPESRWDELIEIALDEGKGGFQVEEDNLIEIDLDTVNLWK